MADLAALPPGPFDKRPWDPYLTGLDNELWQRFRWFVDLCRSELGIEQYVLSGRRTYAEQKYLYDGWKAGKPGFNLAAPPGTSRHESGRAIDAGIGYSRYPRMKDIAARVGLGFVVRTEDWHVEIVSHPAIPPQYTGSQPVPPPEEEEMPPPFVGVNPGTGENAIFYPGLPLRVHLKTPDDVKQALAAPPFGLGLKSVGNLDAWFFRNTEKVDSHQ